MSRLLTKKVEPILLVIGLLVGGAGVTIVVSYFLEWHSSAHLMLMGGLMGFGGLGTAYYSLSFARACAACQARLRDVEVAMPFDRLTEAADALESRDPAEIAAVVDRAPNNWTGTYAVVVLAEICPECRSVGRLQLWKGEILATGAVKKTDSMTEYFEMRGPELGQLMALTESPPTEASGSSS